MELAYGKTTQNTQPLFLVGVPIKNRLMSSRRSKANLVRVARHVNKSSSIANRIYTGLFRVPTWVLAIVDLQEVMIGRSAKQRKEGSGSSY